MKNTKLVVGVWTPVCLSFLAMASVPVPSLARDSGIVLAQADGEQPQVGAPGERDRPTRSDSAEAVYREQGALFKRKLTLEPGVRYTYSDRNDLNLSGFLALDAIFLGSIDLDRVKSNTLTFDLTARYGFTDRFRVDLNVPYVTRYSQFASVGAGGATSSSSDEGISDGAVGDISATMYYEVAEETADRPNVVWNVGITAPTGTEPFGIETYQPDPSNTNLEVPRELPTGNGLWSISTGFSFVKTQDPAILFASVGWRHFFEDDFDDISEAAGNQPGSAVLGDIYSLGGGMAFALNPKLSISLSYSLSVSDNAETTLNGQPTSEVIGSNANAQSLNLGFTYALSNRSTMVVNLGTGLTEDAPDVTLDISFPYQF